MSHPTRVPPTSLRAQAYESFQQQIVEANIRPGQFISQRELMQLLGMPLGAVRELIPRLEAFQAEHPDIDPVMRRPGTAPDDPGPAFDLLVQPLEGVG